MDGRPHLFVISNTSAGGRPATMSESFASNMNK
jgi:hypothetical protein